MLRSAAIEFSMSQSLGCNPCVHTRSSRHALGRKAFCEQRCASAKHSSNRARSQRVCCKASSSQDGQVCFASILATSLFCARHVAQECGFAVERLGNKVARLRDWPCSCGCDGVANDSGAITRKRVLCLLDHSRLFYSVTQQADLLSSRCCQARRQKHCLIGSP